MFFEAIVAYLPETAFYLWVIKVVLEKEYETYEWKNGVALKLSIQADHTYIMTNTILGVL